MKQEFDGTFSESPGNCTTTTITIGVGNADPIRQHPYRIADRLKEGVKIETEKLIADGIIEPSTSPSCSPIVPVTKPDGSVRLCVDYRRLNSIAVQDNYYMPLLSEI